MSTESNDFGYLRMSDIAGKIVPAGKSTIWRWIAEGKFPRPIKLNGTITAWNT